MKNLFQIEHRIAAVYSLAALHAGGRILHQRQAAIWASAQPHHAFPEKRLGVRGRDVYVIYTIKQKSSIRERLTQAKEQASEKTEHRTIDREKVKVKDRSVQRYQQPGAGNGTVRFFGRIRWRCGRPCPTCGGTP